MRAALLTSLAVLFAACAPTTGGATEGAGQLRPFDVEPLPRDERWVIAVPDSSVRAGGVRVGGVLFGALGGRAETVTARVTVDVRIVDAVTAEIVAIGGPVCVDPIACVAVLLSTSLTSA